MSAAANIIEITAGPSYPLVFDIQDQSFNATPQEGLTYPDFVFLAVLNATGTGVDLSKGWALVGEGSTDVGDSWGVRPSDIFTWVGARVAFSAFGAKVYRGGRYA